LVPILVTAAIRNCPKCSHKRPGKCYDYTVPARQTGRVWRCQDHTVFQSKRGGHREVLITCKTVKRRLTCYPN
jgi:hypothetical protein